MKRKSWLAAFLFLLLPAPVVLLSCSGGGGESGPSVRYEVDLEGGEMTCIHRIEYIDRYGVTKSLHSVTSLPWRQIFTGTDGAHLYLYVMVDCDRADARLYIDGSLVKRVTSSRIAEIDGYLRIDENGNATFEDHGDG